MTFPIFLFNTQSSPVVFNDIGLEIPSHDYFEIDSLETFNRFYRTGNQLFSSIGSNIILISVSNVNNPPNSNDRISPSDFSSSSSFGNIDGGGPNAIFTGSDQVIDSGGV